MLYQRGRLMSETEQTTLNLILSAAMKEFLEKGFRAASLRSIVKAAGVTTGAFYGYFKSKEDLFEALVGTQYAYFLNCFAKHKNNLPSCRPNSSRRILAVFPARACTTCFCMPMSI